MVVIYLEELAELVEAFDATTQKLIENPKDKEAIAEAERQLHTVKGGSRMTGLTAIGDLSHAGESLLNLVAHEKVTIDEALLSKLQLVSDELFRMYELAAVGAEIAPVSALVDELHQLSEPAVTPAQSFEDLLEDDTEQLVTEQLESEEVSEPEEPAEAVAVDPMVAIYLEELGELVEAFEESSQNLLDDPKNKESITQAERQLHTIKGGARMTGLMAIGDLSHAGESLLNLVANDKVSADGDLLEKLQIVSDELFKMYEQASQGRDIESAEALIHELHCLAGMDDVCPQKKAEQAEVESTSLLGSDKEAAELAVDSVEEVATVQQEPETVEQKPVDPMVAIFLEELGELTEAFDATTQSLVKNPSDSDAIRDAERQLHTIKGGSRMTGLLAIGDLSHAGESLLNLVASGKVEADQDLLEKLQLVSDTLYKMYETASAGQDVAPVEDLVSELHALSGQDQPEQQKQPVKDEMLEKATESIQQVAQTPEPEVIATKPEGPGPTASMYPDYTNAGHGFSELESILGQHADVLNSSELVERVAPARDVKVEEEKHQTSSIRVPTDLINKLITTTNEWGDQNIRLVELYESNRKKIAELKRTSIRLKEQIRTLELEADSSIHAGGSVADLPKISGSFDPLEMDEYTELQQQSRALSESLEDLMSLTESLEAGLKNMGLVSDMQEKTCRNVQEGLVTTRMTKVTGLLSRLKRIVRQVSNELGKDVVLEIVDENCEMDRTILERITASLEHLIRNSLAHGVEKPDERAKVGKLHQGKITLDINRDGPEIVITLQDDGAGINVEKLRALSVKKGLIAEDDQLSHKEIFQLILMSGVSTADRVSQVSGRGVGMDVVNAEVNSLGGNIVIDSESGKYTRFTLRVPYNLATNQVMFLDVSGEVLALPVAKLEGMQRITKSDLEVAYARKTPTIECAGRSYVMRHLGETLGLGHRGKKDKDIKTTPIILLEENGQRVAYEVDEIRGNREVMLKPLGSLFEESQLISSASILGGGQIVLLLNTHELINLGMNGSTIKVRKVSKKHVRKKATIMVVDDSITVRKITESLLVSMNFNVLTANDGVNALEVLHGKVPDLILLDIEMPRMDGFELLENVRSSEEWSHLPVIMISSRSGSKHRQHAKDLGANGFIGKPWEAEQLSDHIKSCLNMRVEEAAV